MDICAVVIDELYNRPVEVGVSGMFLNTQLFLYLTYLRSKFAFFFVVMGLGNVHLDLNV